MWFNPLTLVVIGANLLGGAMAVPQAVKLARQRSTGGVSPAWAGMSATLNAWWGAYGVGVREWSIVPLSVVSVTVYLSIAIALLRFRQVPRPTLLRPMIAAGAAAAMIPLVALLVEGWAAAGVVLGALYGVQLSPAVIAVYRVHDVTGVSPATWLIAFGEAALWGIYGFARLDVGLVALAVTGVFMSSLVLIRLFVMRPRRSRSPIGLGLSPA